ncbi:hypothetical protein IC757_16015 [Wenzhouxiangella sp. AB-CW3]|uniref:DUF432 domain-containing protein n=1 Tax=Wenzhouxiangella sp. AB-CW3 TaxID=2771012 RepID=UPI00168ABCC8|nr:DUF432 domain-containing protein [Wenzhouxiangella sp. AB-CW3]QOC22489.1 hypothetical protein IC757_16015 [Wenzhouxiangella sp. AB-CW3]
MAAQRKTQQSAWWSPRDVSGGQSLQFSLGPLAMMLGHGEDEWSLKIESSEESADDGDNTRVRVRKGLPDEADERFVHAGQSDQVVLSPRLADRPVVIRPRQPVYLLAGQQITLYLSTPIWLRVEVSDPPVLLKEFPVLRMSDTWFGPSTREGELCYAGRTQARHNLAELPQRPHRAITPMTIHNESAQPVPLEKISLPVPMLSLYGAGDGSLWTQRVTLTLEDQAEQARVKVDSNLPEVQRKLDRLAGPRIEGGRSGMTRALNLLLGN